MTIAILNEMEAQVEVNENDIVRVKLGDTALIWKRMLTWTGNSKVS